MSSLLSSRTTLLRERVQNFFAKRHYVAAAQTLRNKTQIEMALFSLFYPRGTCNQHETDIIYLAAWLWAWNKTHGPTHCHAFISCAFVQLEQYLTCASLLAQSSEFVILLVKTWNSLPHFLSTKNFPCFGSQTMFTKWTKKVSVLLLSYLVHKLNWFLNKM